jgi:hypothetical protein
MVDVLVVVFGLNTLFAIWVLFRGGADWLLRALAEGGRDRSLTPTKLRTLVASLWGVNAFALWTILDG